MKNMISMLKVAHNTVSCSDGHNICETSEGLIQVVNVIKYWLLKCLQKSQKPVLKCLKIIKEHFNASYNLVIIILQKNKV